MKKILSLAVLVMLLLAALAPAALATGDGPHYQVDTIMLPDGRVAQRAVISGPPHPPAGAKRPLAPGAGPNAPEASKQLSVPAYDWSFGCSATSGAMIAAYYDRNGYPNIYTGATNGGVMPMDSSVWGTWKDGEGDVYGQCPLTASRNGLDGRSTRGSIDDYWISYGSGDPDPYIAKGWTQHSYGDAIGDYMKTSQSKYENVDGSTVFYGWSSGSTPFTCADMVNYNATDDGAYGRKLFYEARGYTVTDCYNQPTDNAAGGGFSFAQYKAEIDAGRPVMVNLSGHTVVGLGYDDASKTIYIHDTWDYNTHTMTWGGSYSGMAMESVSIVKVTCPAAGGVTNLAISKVNSTDAKLTWSAVAGADHYEIWSAINKPFFTPGGNCVSPAPFACQTVTGTNLTTKALGDPANNYAYVAKAVNACGGVSTSLSNRVSEFDFALVKP